MAEDDLEPLITECPNCRTRFRVTETQLQLANGRVRCGACLTVFHGVDHLLWDGRETLAGGARAEDVLDEVLEELGSPSVPGKKSGVKPQSDKSKVETVSPPEAWMKRSAPFFGGRESADTAADAGRRQSNPDAYFDTDPSADAVEDSASVTDREAESVTPQPPAEADAAASESEIDPGVWDSASFKILGADPDDVSGSTVPADSPGSVEAAESAESVEWSPDEPGSAEIVRMETPAVPAKAADAGLSGTAPVDDLDAALREPISFAPEPRRWWVPIALAVGVLALLLQIFWYQFQSWGRDPLLRPLYAASCELFGCELPVMQDLRQMRTRNLIVRSHPDTARALIVDAVIVNEWEYGQPFPELELTFKSLNGALVAGRRFKPGEYLSGELASVDEMPPHTPIRIELEIEDPGPEAVNYFLTFR